MGVTKRQPSVNAMAFLLCFLAAGCGSVTASLLYIAAGGIFLLLLTLLLFLFRLKGNFASQAIVLIPAAALVTTLRLLLAAAMPGWLDAMGPEILMTTALLFCAPAAVSIVERNQLSSSKIFCSAVGLLAIGVIRELLTAGTLMGMKILPDGLPYSRSFQWGAAGIILTGLLLALFRMRGQGKMIGYRVKEGLIFSLCTFSLTILTGALYVLVTHVFPMDSIWNTWIALLIATLLSLFGQFVFSPKENESPYQEMVRWSCRDGSLAIFSTIAVLSADWRLGEVSALTLFGGCILAAVIACVVVAVIAALVPRLDVSGNIHLAPAFRPAPIMLTAAGLSLLALSVLPK